MIAVRNEETGTWHLLGARGCGADPDGERVDAGWPKVRDRVDRNAGTRCSNCNWPR
jgi:hypothetical protein